MQGFLPLSKAFAELDFKAEEIEEQKVELCIRAKRMLNFGVWLCDVDVNGKKLIIAK